MHLPPLQAMISSLIAAPSISSTCPALDQSNYQVILLLADWLETLGFKIELQALGNHKHNLIATLGQGSGGLVLSGHTDTVPHDLDRWQSDPFTLTERDNKLYGLGSADMKSFFAFALTAASQFRAGEFKHPLIILATADEETTMSGAKALQDYPLAKPRHALIGEPTNLKPVRMHKGIFMEKIHLQGLAGHSSNPALGHNAIEGMSEVLAALSAWRKQLRETYQHPAFAVPYPTLNFGHIHGGDNANRICGECELHIDLRPLPGMNLSDLRESLSGILQAVAKDSPFVISHSPLFDGIPAIETPATADIVTACEALTQSRAEAVAFGTEAPYLQQMGMHTLILGPGSIDQAHQPNEYLAMNQFRPTLNILQTLIHRYCVEGHD